MTVSPYIIPSGESPVFTMPPGSLATLTACLEASLRAELKDRDRVLEDLCGPMGRVLVEPRPEPELTVGYQRLVYGDGW
jgi:hypothetical protein